MSKHVKITLGVQQAEALLEAASRGLDEWSYELDYGDSMMGSATMMTKGNEAYRKLNMLIKEARKSR